MEFTGSPTDSISDGDESLLAVDTKKWNKSGNELSVYHHRNNNGQEAEAHSRFVRRRMSASQNEPMGDECQVVEVESDDNDKLVEVIFSESAPKRWNSAPARTSSKAVQVITLEANDDIYEDFRDFEPSLGENENSAHKLKKCDAVACPAWNVEKTCSQMNKTLEKGQLTALEEMSTLSHKMAESEHDMNDTTTAEVKANEKEAAEKDVATRHKKNENLPTRKGRNCVQWNTAYIDRRLKGLSFAAVVQSLTEKAYTFEVVENLVAKSIVWKLRVPVDPQGTDSAHSQSPSCQAALHEEELQYLVIVWESLEFMQHVADRTMHAAVSSVQSAYPHYRVCFLLQGLQQSLRREQQKRYRDSQPTCHSAPAVHEALASFATLYEGVHSRLCSNEFDTAEHVAGLHRTLPEARFRPQLSRFQVTQNGGSLSRTDPIAARLRTSVWMKMLTCVPGVAPRDALAVVHKFPSLGSLLRAYAELPSEKEREKLLEGLCRQVEGEDHSRRAHIGSAVSKRVYRVLSAQHASHFVCDVIL